MPPLTSPLTNGTPLPTGSGEDFAWLVGKFVGIINLIIPLLFGLALVVFIWGIMNAWILGGGDQTRIDKGKKTALAGVIGLVVMVGVWGIVALLKSSFF
jgi:hypothetical protein